VIEGPEVRIRLPPSANQANSVKRLSRSSPRLIWPSRKCIRRVEEPKGSNPVPSRRESVSHGNSPFQVEKPGFSAGLRAGASGAVDRDAHGTANSSQRAIISLSGHIPVPHLG
jgi:hypothetical protein